MAELDLPAILQKRAALFGLPRVVKLSDGALALTIDAGPPSLDRKLKMARVLFSTEARDRSRDVVVGKGVNPVNHRRNPVVMMEHKQPVGKAETPDGLYTVKHEAGGWWGDTYFANTVEADQTYQLIDDGVLRGASIGMRPVRYKHLPADPSDPMNMPGLLLEEVELLEYSHCVIPDNQECVSLVGQALSKNRLADRPICEAVRKSLLAAAPAAVAWSNGADFTPPPPPPVVTKADDTFDDPKKSKTDDMDRGELPDRPGGAVVCEGIHDRAVDFAEYILDANKKHENPRVKKLADRVSADLEAWAAACAKMHREEYPDQPPLSDKSDDEAAGDDAEEPADEGDDEADDVEKSLARQQTRERLRKRLEGVRRWRVRQEKRWFGKSMKVCIGKAADQLDDVSGHEGALTVSHKSGCAYHSSALRSMVKDIDAAAADGGAGEGDDDVTKGYVKVPAGEWAKIAKRMEVLAQNHERLVRDNRLLRQGR